MLRIDDETKRNDHKLLVRRVLHVYLGGMCSFLVSVVASVQD